MFSIKQSKGAKRSNLNIHLANPLSFRYTFVKQGRITEKKNIGIIIIGSLDIVFGALGSIMCILGFYLFGTIWSIAMLLIGIGLLKRKEWARIGQLIFIAIRYIFTFGIISYHLIKGIPVPTQYTFTGVSTVLGISIAVIIVYYLTRPKVKEQFK